MRMIPTIAEVWPVFLDKSRIAAEHRVEVGGMTDTLTDMLDAVVSDPDGFISLLKEAPVDGVEILSPFFEEIAELPDSRKWLEAIHDAIKGRANDIAMQEIRRLL